MPRALADDGYRWFAAVFLDAELQGGPLEGPHLDDVVENFLLFLNHTEAGKYHLSEDTFTAIKAHLANISLVDRLTRTGQNTQVIAEFIVNELQQHQDVFFPGGWTAEPAGHAMIYRLFYDATGHLVFLAYNTGAGAQHHKKIASTNLEKLAGEKYREKFNPVYAIYFPHDEKLKQYGGLQAWINTLLESRVRPHYDTRYRNNNADGLYHRIFQASAYLDGEVVDPTPYYAHITAGQRSGTCGQYSVQKMLRGFFKQDTDFDRFILDYRLYVLQTYNKLPKSYQRVYEASIANTARMITEGKDLEHVLTLDDKQVYLEKLEQVKTQAALYFAKLPELVPSVNQPKNYTDQSIHLPSLLWTPGDTTILEKSEFIHENKPLLLFDKTGPFLDALNRLEAESDATDKRLFVYNLEQVCFTFCDRLKTFKSKPFEYEGKSEQEWLKASMLLHKYSVDYLEHCFKKELPVELYNFLFAKELPETKRKVNNEQWIETSASASPNSLMH